MCLWGVIHGRKFVNRYGVKNIALAGSPPTVVVPPDPRRVAITLIAPNLSLNANDGLIFIFIGTDEGVPQWCLDKYNQCKTFTIEEWGSSLLDSISALTSSGAISTVYFTDVLTNESDDQLAMKLYENKGYIR